MGAETDNYYLGYAQSVDEFFGLAPCPGGDNEIDFLMHTAHSTKNGSMTNLRDWMNNLDSSTLKIGWGDVSCTTTGDECCVLLDLVREGIGWDSGSYEPVADARYITLGSSRWNNTFSEAEDVWGWADDQLAGFNASIAPPECTDTDCQSATGCPTDNGREYDGRGG